MQTEITNSKMKNIVIKTEEGLQYLRTEAVAKAIEYEETQMDFRKEGKYNCVVWVKHGMIRKYQFIVYHTKTSIVVNVSIE